MFENRIQNLFADLAAPTAASHSVSGFVACQLGSFAVPGTYQESFIAEIYRHAQELMKTQQATPPRAWQMPEFSSN